MPEPTPWRRLLATAHALRLAPDAFWRLSLREWRALTATSGNALSREAFAALAARYPDLQR